jgi:vesicle-associated membrane protein 4
MYSALINYIMNNIKYVFIGNFETGKTTTEYSVIKNSNTQTAAKKILQKYKDSPSERVFDERHKIKGNSEGHFYFVLYKQSTFIFVQADEAYSDQYVYKLIDNIHSDHIPIMVNEEGELIASGRQLLKQLVDKYQDTKNISVIAGVQGDVNEIHINMQDNIRKVVSNIDNAKNLEDQSNKIKNISNDYSKNAKDLERLTWWNNCKWTIIIIAAIILLILIIVLPIVLTGSKTVE